MNPIETEAWAKRMIQRVRNKQPHEDSRVELKSEWIEAKKAARQIAGHANAVRGDNLLWLIGLDENRGVVGADEKELSKWWPQVKAEFESESPTLVLNLAVQEQDKVVVALLLDTNRFPFVIKNPNVQVNFEVPWREGNSTRSAKRSELVTMLAPLIKVPKLELLEGIIRLNMTPTPVFIFQLTVYIVPMGLEPLVFPFHKTKAVLSYLSAVVADNFSNTTVSHETEPESLRADEPNKWWASNSENIRATRDQVEVKGPGRMYIRGAGDGARYAGQWDFDLRFEMLEARSGLPVSIQGKFLRATTGENRDRWILEPQ